MAVHAKHLDTAEVAYAAIQEADKVYYIQYIKELPLKEARAAEMSVMTGSYQDAENMLLQSGLVFRAILLIIYYLPPPGKYVHYLTYNCIFII